MRRRSGVILLIFPVFLLLLNGCDLLLGSDPESTWGQINWASAVITTGEISGLDAAVSPSGVVSLSYIHNKTNVRTSSRSGDEWVHVDGPQVIGSQAEEYTRIAARADGSIAVMYYSESDIQIATVSPGFISLEPLAELDADLIRGTRPATWSHDSTYLAYGPDDLLRAVVRDVDLQRLWMFRETSTGWELNYIDESVSTSGPTDLVISASGDEHIVFSANGVGWYFRRKANSNRWVERLRIPDDPPYRIGLRADDSSVLATHLLYRIRVAEEIINPVTYSSSWHVREVVDNEILHWHNLDMILDDKGFPGILYILGPYWGNYFEVWYAHLKIDGTWNRLNVAKDLSLDTFNPFHVRLVREPAGRVHVILTSGKVIGSSGGIPIFEHHLMDIWTDDPDGGS
ncbi:hypothetical protein ACFL3H_02600 [Gemmatimonadota bacterium]